jgi:hypothetical protein
VPDISLSCACGHLSGGVRDLTPEAGTHLVCYCVDCQAYARHLGVEGVTDAAGGTRIFQTSTGRIRIEQGAERLRCVRMSARGPLRWYAGCCRTPIVNSAPIAAVPFGGIVLACLPGPETDAALGPLQAEVFTRSAHPGAATPGRDRGMVRVATRMARIALLARLAGDHRRSPFFDAGTGRPVAAPEALTAQERRSAYAS